MNIRTLYILFFILNFNLSFGQIYTLIPNKGIEDVPIIVDTTTISDVINLYGNDYSKSERKLITSYKYEKIGLTFEVNAHDKNQIVRSIVVEAPFQAKTTDEIILNESTMSDVWNLYNERGCFESGNIAYRPQNGITFFIKKDINEKGFNYNEKIYAIEINNKGKYGITSRVNFESNKKPIEDKLSDLLIILKADIIDTTKLNFFWEKEKITEEMAYGLKKRTEFKREIEKKLLQEHIEMSIYVFRYYLNIIKSDGNIVYLKFTDKNDSILLERNDNLFDADFDVYTYGTFCGIVGTPPDKCKEMLNLVKENNYKKLAEWLKSINPELATYGYIGLNFLERKGIKLQPMELKRMKELGKLNIQLNTCQGCFFGVTEKMSNVLSKNNLTQIYNQFKQSGWLR